jgi:hypothetical protein
MHEAVVEQQRISPVSAFKTQFNMCTCPQDLSSRTIKSVLRVNYSRHSYLVVTNEVTNQQIA